VHIPHLARFWLFPGCFASKGVDFLSCSADVRKRSLTFGVSLKHVQAILNGDFVANFFAVVTEAVVQRGKRFQFHLSPFEVG